MAKRETPLQQAYNEIDKLKETIAGLERRQGMVSLATYDELEENHRRGVEIIRERDKEIHDLKKEIRMLKSENFALKRQLAASNEKSEKVHNERGAGRKPKQGEHEHKELILTLRNDGNTIRQIKEKLEQQGIKVSVGAIHAIIRGS